MKSEELEEKGRRAEEYLRIIERTRLLYNTSAELGEVVGFSIESGNGLARKGGRSAFMKDAVLRELIHMTEERTNLNLERVLEAYVDSDRMIQKYRHTLRGKDVCGKIVRHFYAEAPVDETLQALIAEMERRHVPILILMLMGILPPLAAKGGDVKGIDEDYRRVFSQLRSIVCSNINFRTLPTLTEMEVWANRNPEALCRIDLIDCVYLILEAYGAISTPEHLSKTNVDVLSQQFLPELDGIWTEDEASTVFWKFKAFDNGHNLCRYVLNSERREVTFMEFHIRFFSEEGGGIHAVVMHPHLIQCIVHQTPIPNDYFATLDLTTDEEGAVDRLGTSTLYFKPKTSDSHWFHLQSLKRSKREHFFQSILEDESYKKINAYPEDEYTFTLCLAAITEDALYIWQDEGSYLRVPKSLNPQFSDVRFGENIGLIRLHQGRGRQKETVFLSFDDRRLYYEVTTAKQRQELGIEVVERIEHYLCTA